MISVSKTFFNNANKDDTVSLVRRTMFSGICQSCSFFRLNGIIWPVWCDALMHKFNFKKGVMAFSRKLDKWPVL